MKHDGTLGIRVPGAMLKELERERDEMSRRAGVDVPMSAVVRVLVTEALRDRKSTKRRKRTTSERAA